MQDTAVIRRHDFWLPSRSSNEADALNPAVYPRLSAFLNRLPGGYEAYPECTTVADVARVVQTRYAELWSDRSLPHGLRQRLKRAWRPGEHASSVVVGAQCLILQDRVQMSQAAVRKLYLQPTLEMFARPIYRTITRAMSPSLLLLGVSWRWDKFNCGTRLTPMRSDKNHHVLSLTYPVRLYDRMGLEFFGDAFAALTRAAHALEPQVRIYRVSEGETHFCISWL